MCSVTESPDTAHPEDRVPGTLQDLLAEMQHLVSAFETVPDPALRRDVFRLLDLVDLLHREGLQRLVAGLTSIDMLEKALDDPIVANLLAIYELIPSEPPNTLVQRGLDEIREYVQSHGGDVRLDRIEGGTVHIDLLGACVGCPSTEVTIGQAIEEAIRRHWPALIRVQASDGSPRAVPLQIRPKPTG
jgi:Fe-S cluster biogenesis protein NfuA